MCGIADESLVKRPNEGRPGRCRVGKSCHCRNVERMLFAEVLELRERHPPESLLIRRARPPCCTLRRVHAPPVDLAVGAFRRDEAPLRHGRPDEHVQAHLFVWQLLEKLIANSRPHFVAIRVVLLEGILPCQALAMVAMVDMFLNRRHGLESRSRGGCSGRVCLFFAPQHLIHAP